VKIGDFAIKHKLTIDSVRHYIDLGLILPEKRGSHFFFGGECDEDIREVLSLKEYGFSLMEIRQMLNIKRLTNPAGYEKNLYYLQFFQTKLKDISDKISRLHKSEEKLKERLDKVSESKSDNKNFLGISLNVLKYLSCPYCRSALNLKSGNIVDNRVASGELSCNCGRKYSIEDGILISDRTQPMENPFGDNIDGFFFQYLQEIDREYIDHLVKDIRWLKNKFAKVRKPGQTFLDIGVGYGAFLRNIYPDLMGDSIYISVDHNISILRSLKKMLEEINPQKEIVLICCDMADIPLGDSTVDTLIDIGGSSSFNQNNEANLLAGIKPLLKGSSQLLGLYVISGPGRYDKNFQLPEIQSRQLDLGFEILDMRVSQPGGTKIPGHYICHQRNITWG